VSGTDTSLDGTDSPMLTPASMPPTGGAPRMAQQLDAVSASLRKAYSATVAEDVPDALLDLLKQLK
jgi:hypothetical protein